MSQRRKVAERQRQQQRRRRRLLAYGSVGTVLLVVAVMILVRVARPDQSTASPTVPVSQVVTQALAVSPATLDTVGRGATGSLPTKLTGQPPLLADGKPLVLYVGAEYCPFCAAQRWALVIALTRFGTFDGLQMARSASDDAYPSTATVSFHGSSYTSKYLSFQGVELATSERQGGRYAPLDTLTATQDQVMRTYNAPPYVSAESAGAVPFVDFGNAYLHSGSAYSPALLKGLTHEQIAAAFANPKSPLAQAVLGSANAMTAVLCQLTAGQPATVCGGAAARAYGDLNGQA